MPEWKQFGEVILNLDRVIKVERRGDAVKVYMAGLLATSQGSGLGAADATPGARTFGGDEAPGGGEFFPGPSKAPGGADAADSSAPHATGAAAPTMHTIM